MTFRVLLVDQAQYDFEGIEGYLDARAPEQSERFIRDFEETLGRIAAHALLRPEIRPGVRCESLVRFRYHLWYRVFPEIEQVEVFAVLHHRRGPEALEARF